MSRIRGNGRLLGEGFIVCLGEEEWRRGGDCGHVHSLLVCCKVGVGRILDGREVEQCIVIVLL